MPVEATGSNNFAYVPTDESVGSSTLGTLNSVDELAVELGGDTNAQVAAMLLKHAHDTKRQTRTARMHEEHHLRDQEATQVKRMREQADLEYHAAVKRAAGGMVSGLTQMGAGVACMSGTAEAETKVATGGGELFKAGMDGLAAGDDLKASNREIEGVAADQRAQASARRMEDLKAAESDATELIRTALDFVRGASDADAQANRTAIFQRA